MAQWLKTLCANKRVVGATPTNAATPEAKFSRLYILSILLFCDDLLMISMANYFVNYTLALKSTKIVRGYVVNYL